MKGSKHTKNAKAKAKAATKAKTKTKPAKAAPPKVEAPKKKKRKLPAIERAEGKLAKKAAKAGKLKASTDERTGLKTKSAKLGGKVKKKKAEPGELPNRARGESHPRCTLAWADVKNIRRAWKNRKKEPVTMPQLAKHYDVAKQYIFKIVHKQVRVSQ